MLGEILKMYLSPRAKKTMDKNTLKLTTMFGYILKIYLFPMAKNTFKLSTMFGANFEIYSTEIAKNAFKLSTIMLLNVIFKLF